MNASGLEVFEPVCRALSNIVVYNPVPHQIRGLKPEKRCRNLDRNGSGVAEALYHLKETDLTQFTQIIDYLRRINSNVLTLEAIKLKDNYDLRFELDRGAEPPEEFSSQNMSDGTLRTLAILTALFQASKKYPVDIVGLEEPETGLHPAAASVLFDSLTEGSEFRQVVVTSYSPDLLDREVVPESSIKAVVLQNGETLIGGADEIGREATRQRLNTAGELLRLDQLRREGAVR